MASCGEVGYSPVRVEAGGTGATIQAGVGRYRRRFPVAYSNAWVTRISEPIRKWAEVKTMKRELDAAGQWYLRPDTHETFQLIDWDEQSGTARVQMCDGSLDEIDEDSWRALSPEPVETPEDWTGSLDNLETGDPRGFFAESEEPADEDCFRDDQEP
jgi:hypothetical protein